MFQLHIQAICRNPEVSARWTAKHGKNIFGDCVQFKIELMIPKFILGKAPTDDDAERIYSKSLSATLDMLPSNSKMIKGAQTFLESRDSHILCMMKRHIIEFYFYLFFYFIL